VKKVLILAYDFPPYNSIGAQRPYSWLLYFKEFGLEPIVVTRHWDRPISGPDDCNLPSLARSVTTKITEHGTIIRAPFEPSFRDRLIPRSGIHVTILRKVLSVWQLLFEHYFEAADNKRTIMNTAHEVLKQHKVDLILACGEPFVLFRYAAELSQEFSIPWIGDYRDGWSTNYRWDDAKLYGLIQKHVQQRVELDVTRSAALLTTAAPSFSERISKLTGRNVNDIPVVYNGYFEERFEGIRNPGLSSEFTIVHAGTLYYFQKVETFLKGANLLLQDRPQQKFKVVFYGLNFYPAQIDRINAAKGNVTVEFVDKQPHETMLRTLASSHVQLLLATPEKHQIYAKVFDYMGTGRPILMVENDKGPLEEILKGRKNAAICSSPEEVSEALKRFMNEPDLLKAIRNEDNTFTRRNQARRMAELVLRVIDSKA
jgi:glycosyltransferase involved in cell wall biosynthesis